MQSFFSTEELQEIGFKKLGKNIFLSRKASIYNPQEIEIGDNVRIDDFCILSGKICLNNYIHVAAYSALYGGDVGIIVSDYCNISSKVCMYAISDDYSGESMTSPLIPDIFKILEKGEIFLDKHVIIGSGCTVLPGVHLSEGSAFGAMTLINRDSEAWSINVGIPFRKLRERKKEILKVLKKFEQYINNRK